MLRQCRFGQGVILSPDIIIFFAPQTPISRLFAFEMTVHHPVRQLGLFRQTLRSCVKKNRFKIETMAAVISCLRQICRGATCLVLPSLRNRYAHHSARSAIS
jgi:hypothetical protein